MLDLPGRSDELPVQKNEVEALQESQILHGEDVLRLTSLVEAYEGSLRVHELR